jgi:ribosomal protein S18 acetylase RimI-like enzyme
VVKSECRNRGIGTKLLEASKKWAKDKGMEYLRLSVFPTNESGIRFYKRHGLMEQMLAMECSLM